jgi:hypothetical protein
MASKHGGRKVNKYCSPEIDYPSEAVEGMNAKRRSVHDLEKAEVPEEETVECTLEAAGVGVSASMERFSEITTGRSYFQPGRRQPAKTLFIGDNRRDEEDLGLAHEVVIAMKGR